MIEPFGGTFSLTKSQWTDEGRIMRVETPRATFVKPKLWQQQYYGSQVFEAMERSSTRSMSNVHVITHAENLPIGSMQSGTGEADDEKLPFINYLVKELRSDKFKWTAYGVAPKEGFEHYAIQEIPSTMLVGHEHQFHDLFLDCKIPFHDMAVVDDALLEPLASNWYSTYIARQ